MSDDPPLSLEAQIAVMRTEIGFIRDHITNGHADHEARLRGLEQFKWLIVGASAAAGASAGTITARLFS